MKVMRRAYIMLHELSHMWCGDLVTPSWWSELWLKEGFATFFGYKMLVDGANYFKFKNIDSEVVNAHLCL
jgi:aminopeptidase N